MSVVRSHICMRSAQVWAGTKKAQHFHAAFPVSAHGGATIHNDATISMHTHTYALTKKYASPETKTGVYKNDTHEKRNATY